ncbi:MAG: ATP-binding protein [Candidatus Hodarchaeota archaeon]
MKKGGLRWQLKSFSLWGKIFDSTTMATAITHRLVYNSGFLILERSSYRRRIKNC